MSGLDDAALHDVAARIREASTVVFLTGAGLSVASGIAPYRKSKDAVWSRFITEWGTIARFHDDPHAWWTTFWIQAHGKLSSADSLAHVQPNPGHHALTTLLRRNPQHVVLTQNIDGLHRRAGVPETQLIEIHGRHDRFVCTRAACSRVREPLDHVDLDLLEQGSVPRCDRCGAPLRPLVLLFDEMYDSHPAYGMRRAREKLESAELIVFVGTSFSVGITEYAVRAGLHADALLVNVNVEAVEHARFVNLLGPAEEVLPLLQACVATRS